MIPNQAIDHAFAEREDLRKRIYDVIPKAEGLQSLFVDIAEFIQRESSRENLTQEIGEGQHPKKRKLVAIQDLEDQGKSHEDWKTGSYCLIQDVSFSIPQRKKLTLEIGNSASQGIRGRNPSSNDVEFTVKWKDIQHAVCLPVPEKAQVQHNFCIFSANSDSSTTTSMDKKATEQVLWTVPDTAVNPASIEVGNCVQPDETYKTLLLRLLNERLRPFDRQVKEPDEKEFVSQTSRPYSNGKKATHVKAFRGSKDGFLFFLSNGIAWGFKKPLAFFGFDRIESLSYTSVLQRTFNLNITVRNSAVSDDIQELEFSMLDQADFASIDSYVKRHELQDSSMAEQRRAKRLNINGVQGLNGEDAEIESHDAEGELEKARRELEDAEDEEEEDENFDPGSEGESEGSGSSGEEEDLDDQSQGADLVQEELGSEAEEPLKD